jgi:FHS family L-fucose permease-like MFS transporter
MASGTAPLSSATVAGTPAQTSYRTALVTLTTLFFMWGFLTCLNDVIIPHLKAVFELNYLEAMLVQFCFFLAYGIMSIPSGFIVRKMGYKRGMMVGLGGAALGCLLFYPAAGTRSYPLFLLAFFVLASGIVILQVSANPYVAVLGPPETASSRLTLTQAFNSLATTVAPLFGRNFILSTPVLGAAALAALTPAQLEAYRLSEAQSVQHPYVGLALALVALAAVIFFAKLPSIQEAAPVGADARHGRSAWSHPHLVLGAVAIFAYVGAEVAIGSLLINYFKVLANMTEQEGAGYLPYYWGGAMVGRFIGTLTLRKYKPGRVLGVHALVAGILVLLTVVTHGAVAMWSVIAVGLFNSIMFPTIFTLAIDGLGTATEEGSGILCTAIVGGALIPALQGAMADSLGLQPSFILPVICYAYIAWYGVKGSALRRQAAG